MEYLQNHLARSRTKISQAAKTLIQHTTTYAEFDAYITPPAPSSNPWITDDVTFWTLNADLVDVPTERRVRRWGISISDVLRDPTGRREFEKYLQTEYSHENIRFWIACNRLKNMTPTSLIAQRAKEIFE
jgi:regulator of G-protein signaling